MKLRSYLHLLKNNVLLFIGALMLMVVIVAAVFPSWFAPYDPLVVNLRHKLYPMGRIHPLGTDGWGRDILSRVIHGSRYSLIIGVASISLAMVFGGLFGVLGGYYSESKFATVVVWITDIVMSFPTLIMGAMVAIIFGAGLLNTILALSIAFFPRFIRLARGATLSMKEEVYIAAGRSLGMSDLRLLLVHLVPNIISPLVVMGVIWVSVAIALEVALSFLGLGIPPPTPSWGNIVQDNLKYFHMEPLPVLWPCLAVAWTILALNLIGDRFRDILDPKMR